MNEYQSNFYTNGATQPPKNRGGIIAIVLCILILTVGITTFIDSVTDISIGTDGISYVHFTREAPPSSFPGNAEHGLPPFPGDQQDTVKAELIGLTGAWISRFDQIFREIPAGLYITETPENSEIEAGDILVAVDSTRVANEQALSNVLFFHVPGDTLTLTLYRDGVAYTTEIVLTEAE